MTGDENQIQTSESQTNQLLSSQEKEPMRKNSRALVHQLKDFCGSNDIVEIYAGMLNDSKFIACFILAMSDNDILLALIHPNGYYDGFAVLPLSDISRIDVSTKYCNALQKLWNETDIYHDSIEQKEENQFSNLLIYAYKKHKIISAELLESGTYDIVGYISGFEGSEIIIIKVDEYGEFDGMSITDLSDITHLACDSEDERKLSRLWKINEKSRSSSTNSKKTNKV